MRAEKPSPGEVRIVRESEKRTSELSKGRTRAARPLEISTIPSASSALSASRTTALETANRSASAPAEGSASPASRPSSSMRSSTACRARPTSVSRLSAGPSASVGAVRYRQAVSPSPAARSAQKALTSLITPTAMIAAAEIHSMISVGRSRIAGRSADQEHRRDRRR